MPEFQPYKMLTEGGTCLPADNDKCPAPATLDNEDCVEAVGILMDVYGQTEEEAQAMVRANAADLGSMFARMGPPPEDEPEDAQPPAVEAVLEPEEEAPADHTDAVDGDYSFAEYDDHAVHTGPLVDADAQEAPAPVVAEAVASDPVPGPPAEHIHYEPEAHYESEPRMVSNDHPPTTVQAQLPDAAAIPPMFPERPESCYQIEQRFEALGEMEDFWKLVAATWKKVTKQERPGTLIPSPGTCNGDAELLENLTKALLAKAEGWWFNIGYAKHGQA